MNGTKPTPLRIELPLEGDLVSPCVEFICATMPAHDLERQEKVWLREMLRRVLTFCKAHNAHGNLRPALVEVTSLSDGLHVSVVNRGAPIHPSHIPQGFFEGDCPAIDGTSCTFTNKGRQGQTFELRIPRADLTPRVEPTPSPSRDNADGGAQPILQEMAEEIVYRDLLPGEEDTLSSLFHRIYGYDYVNEWVYSPSEFRALIQNGELHSVVASTTSGRILGHIGIRTWNKADEVVEMCLGLTDPTVKSRGFFSGIFDACIQKVRETRSGYCFFDCVTNHDFSQRHIEKHGGVDIALFVGCQSKQTQARLEHLGLGQDCTEMDRYSLLYAILRREEHPFGREVALPPHLGDLLGFLIEPLGLTWVPTSRVNRLAAAGHYTRALNPLQNAVTFEMEQLGRSAVVDVIADWRRLLRDGYEYAAIDVPLGFPGLGVAQEILSEQGFFVAGFLPWRNSKTLCLRLQALAPRRVAFDHIRVRSAQAKQLLKIVRADFERNTRV